MFSLQNLCHLPVEMLELVLMRAYLMLYSRNDVGDTDSRPFTSDDSRSAQCRVFTVLCSVCWSCWKALSDWPEAPTPHWVRRRVKRRLVNLVEREYRPTFM